MMYRCTLWCHWWVWLQVQLDTLPTTTFPWMNENMRDWYTDAQTLTADGRWGRKGREPSPTQADESLMDQAKIPKFTSSKTGKWQTRKQQGKQRYFDTRGRARQTERDGNSNNHRWEKNNSKDMTQKWAGWAGPDFYSFYLTFIIFYKMITCECIGFLSEEAILILIW